MCSLEKRGRIFVLTLTGPTPEHRLGPTSIAAIRSALAEVRSQSVPGSALLTTADPSSRFFSNGFDLPWAQSTPSPSAALSSMVTLFSPLAADLLSLPMPTVAALTGHAAAAGLVLALCHDHLAMRGDRAVLYMSELDIGLPFPPYFMAIMRSKIADRRALRDVAMRSSRLRAEEAQRRGIVDLVGEGTEGTLAAAMKLAEELAARGWDGKVYASIRKAAFPDMCKAVGLTEESEEERRQLFASKL